MFVLASLHSTMYTRCCPQTDGTEYASEGIQERGEYVNASSLEPGNRSPAVNGLVIDLGAYHTHQSHFSRPRRVTPGGPTQ